MSSNTNDLIYHLHVISIRHQFINNCSLLACGQLEVACVTTTWSGDTNDSDVLMGDAASPARIKVNSLYLFIAWIQSKICMFSSYY